MHLTRGLASSKDEICVNMGQLSGSEPTKAAPLSLQRLHQRLQVEPALLMCHPCIQRAVIGRQKNG